MKTAPADVLDAIRSMVDDDTPPLTTASGPLMLTPTAEDAADPVLRLQTTQALPASENRFVDSIARSLDAPSSAEHGPLIRPVERKDRSAPVPDTSATAVPASAPARVAAEPEARVMCKLLLTAEFQIRPPEIARLPHPLDPLARDGYVEDSDLDRAALQDAAAEMSEVLRSAVSQTINASLDGGDRLGGGVRDFLDSAGRVDPEAFQEFVRDVVRDQLRTALDAGLAGRIEDVVRAELDRRLQDRTRDA